MIDIKHLREHPDVVKKACEYKNASVGPDDIDHVLELDVKRRIAMEKMDDIRRRRNELAATAKHGRPSAEDIERGKQLKDQLATLEADYKQLDEAYLGIMKRIPNLPTEDVPIGKTEDDNVVARTVGEKPQFDFEPKNHWQIAEAAGWIDKERAAKVTGARFAYIKGGLARLQFAVISFTLDTLADETKLKTIAKAAGLSVSSKPFVPVIPPLMIREEVFEAMDRLEPREDRYKIANQDSSLWLQGSAEHVLGSMHMNEILPEGELPIRYVGYATSFREEAGSYGKDMEGIFRMHQFDKLELESLTTRETSLEEHEFMVAIQEFLLGELGISYQVIMKCTADIGKPNARGIDLDAWLPGQDKYRETHTADYMTDYQARRLQTRVRRTDGTVELVHTNDATAFALGRTMIAILENHQQSDGSIRLPKVLHSYFGAETL